ncbi:GHKL domain-containing protein [Nakamurella sp. YIM 132087]|uniref:histidine kinase n=1 Tax=Nakamurella alba TaxID=2665158 RepID=A0A7K1FIV9_9ACTN|nr:sensor histidine kinase [Nakamurella alba]MTD14057.1 GHKL domain-containing protein [Nakamurella alba]
MRRWSLARQLFVVQTVLLTVVVLAVGAIAFALERSRDRSHAEAQVLRAAQSIAADPVVMAGVAGSDPTAALQPYALWTMATVGADFIVIMTPDGIRWTHANPDVIGGRYLGTIEPAVAGGTVVEQYTGTLGPSVRAVAPVIVDGQVVALVSVGITLERLWTQLVRTLPTLALLLAGVLAIAATGAWWVARQVRRRTRDAAIGEIENALAAQEAVLQSLKEGLVALDDHGRIRWVNPAARTLLGLHGEDIGRPVAGTALQGTLAALLVSGRAAVDEPHLVGDTVLIVNQRSVRWGGRSFGTVATLRDHTELRSATDELASTKAFADSLAAQSHETANRLHTMVMLIETGRPEEALRYATEQIELSQRVTDEVTGQVDHPVLAALLIGKAAQAEERGAALDLRVEVELAGITGWLPDSDIVTVVGNLLDNAIEASTAGVTDQDVARVRLTLTGGPGELGIVVEDNGPGIPDEDLEHVRERGWSTKGPRHGSGRGIGLALVDRATRRYHGTLQIDRGEWGGARFTVHLPAPAVAPARVTGPAQVSVTRT